MLDTLDLTDVKFDLLVAEYDQYELKCEMTHKHTVCSVEVTHLRLIECTGAQYKVCANTVAFAAEHAAEVDHNECNRPCSICWTYRPI